MAEPSSRNQIRAGSLRIVDPDGQPYEGTWLGMTDDVEGKTAWLRLGGIADGGTRRLSLAADRVHVSGRLGIGVTDPQAALHVGGDLRVDGKQNLLEIFSQTIVARNAGNDVGKWSVSHPNRFSQVYAAIPIYQGFALAVKKGDVDTFASTAEAVRWADARAVSQHQFVRVTNSTVDQTSGVAYVAEANRDYESDNGILLTIVVFGKGL